MNGAMAEVGEIRRQYERWPYPRVPLLARVPSTDPLELHCAWLWDRCGSGAAPARPRIWLAGCGTFQPHVFAVANPHAEIVASDLSESSLQLARRRCRVHGQHNVRWQACDLTDESTWPEGRFDLIECYGVLMNLEEPQTALRRLGERLTPGGVLRVMLYPQFSRTRIFQLQRLARLLGFTAAERNHPARFRALVRSLPDSHPLRHAFTGYADSRNDAGVVDAFLHAGDRGFTAFQLRELVHGAGLRTAWFFHRPWAQPAAMGERLGFAGRSPYFTLNYLDLWQELRGNWVLCLKRRGDADVGPAPRALHPLLCGGGPLRHRLRLLRFRGLGGRIAMRTTGGDVVLTARQFRALRGGALPDGADPLTDAGIVLGGAGPGPVDSDGGSHDVFAREGEFLAPRLEVGPRAPNPLYAHLFQAWTLGSRHPELGLPDLDAQLGRWLPWADPLENRQVPFGLTPYRTLGRYRANIDDHLARAPLPHVADYAGLRLRNDRERLADVLRLLGDCDGPPRRTFADAELRELWFLLLGYGELFVTTG